jgi:hypothetical protein
MGEGAQIALTKESVFSMISQGKYGVEYLRQLVIYRFIGTKNP